MSIAAPAMPGPHVFAGNPYDRAQHLRRDARWLAKAVEDEASRFLPLWRLMPLVTDGARPAIAWQPPRLVRDLATEGSVVLLGLDGGRARFAADVSALTEPLEEGPFGGAGTFVEVRAVAPLLAAGEAGILAQARAMVDWHLRHSFCAVCGAKTAPHEGGYMRRCQSSSCAAEHFPRTDPVVIMILARGDSCLLGRQEHFPEGMYSALAGFVEPGESIEEAVRREVAEEVAIDVSTVRYHSTQPWPFPSSLMIGCIAETAAEAITIDKAELEDARWFTRAEVRAALAAAEGNEGLRMPPPMSIAHQLARWWAMQP